MSQEYQICFDMLLNGTIIQAATCPFTVAMGFWWVMILIFLGNIGLYVWTREVSIPALATLITTGVFHLFLPPYAQLPLYLLAVIMLGASIYLAYRGRDGN